MAEASVDARLWQPTTGKPKNIADTDFYTTMTHRKGHLNNLVAERANFTLAFDGYARQKHSRDKIKDFERELDRNLDTLCEAYANGEWQLSDYEERWIVERKRRRIAVLPPKDHVVQWAQCNIIEKILTDTFIRQSCSCVPGRGTHDFMRLLQCELQDIERTRFFSHIDAHHYFELIDHTIMKARLRSKIKDPYLLKELDKVIDSYHQGLPLGTKEMQTFANFYLADFDHKAQSLFGIASDLDAMAYWRKRYVSDAIATCRTEEQAREISRGIAYLNEKFNLYVAEGIRYMRFADDILIMHGDKTFLRLVVEMAIMHLTRDYHCVINAGTNVRPVSTGIDICGYVFYHDHTALRKRNKKALCKEVAKWRKRGLQPEEIRLKCASRIGFAKHADARNLLKKLDINMEKRLGKVIKNHKSQIPFKGMRYDQKRQFSEIVCPIGGDEAKYKIELRDYSIDDSIVDQGKKRLAIRYAQIIASQGEGDNETYTYATDANGKVQEWYSYTGSSIMIDQAQNDFSHEDLPCPTVVQEMENKFKKRFYKFT